MSAGSLPHLFRSSHGPWKPNLNQLGRVAFIVSRAAWRFPISLKSLPVKFLEDSGSRTGSGTQREAAGHTPPWDLGSPAVSLH